MSTIDDNDDGAAPYGGVGELARSVRGQVEAIRLSGGAPAPPAPGLVGLAPATHYALACYFASAGPDNKAVAHKLAGVSHVSHVGTVAMEYANDVWNSMTITHTIEIASSPFITDAFGYSR